MSQVPGTPSSPVEFDSFSDLIKVLTDRSPGLAMAFAAGSAIQPTWVWAYRKARARRTYTVKISAADDMYDEVHSWVLSLLPRGEQHALIAFSSTSAPLRYEPRSSEPLHLPGDDFDEVLDAIEAAAEDEDSEPQLRLRYDGSRVQVLRIGSYRVKVSVNESDQQAENANGGYWKPPEIVFTARSLAGRDEVLLQIAALLKRSYSRDRIPSLRMLGTWGGWDRIDRLPPRPLSSVILAEGQRERLVGDVQRFLGAERDYLRRGLPWHRGHLYQGPPGTGKTSVARALANHFGMDVWYLPLADMGKDGELLRLASRIGPRSMLLLEDIDVFHAATARDDDKNKVTLSGLLNALDGFVTPHGLLTVMTTNDPAKLDPALTRPGRVDLIEDFGEADDAQIAGLVAGYYDVPLLPLATRGLGPVVPGDVIEVCKQYEIAEAALAHLRAEHWAPQETGR